MLKTILRLVGVITLCIGLLTACSHSTKKNVDPYAGMSATYLYALGHNMAQKDDYSDAVKVLESLNSQYPFTQYSKLGTLTLIYSYYRDGDPALALATASRYIRLYPTDPDAAYAYYMMGVIDFNNGRGFLERHFPYAMSQHAISNYQAAYKNFQMVISQYPQSIYTTDARRRMMYLKSVMAQYELNIAEFYYQQGAYVASANRASNVLIHYPHTIQVEAALALMVKDYHALDLPNLANQTARLLGANFPANPEGKNYQPLPSEMGPSAPVQHIIAPPTLAGHTTK